MALFVEKCQGYAQKNLKFSKGTPMQFMEIMIEVQLSEAIMICIWQTIAIRTRAHTVIWDTVMKEVNRSIN